MDNNDNNNGTTMQRIVIIGCPGSGKSTFAHALQPLLNLPLFHLDMIYHRRDHTTVTTEEFDRRLVRIINSERWIIDGNYMRTLELRFKAADTVYYLDLPTQLCLQGVYQREGRKRCDMPWSSDQNDEEFIEYIRSFRMLQRPTIEALLDRYAGHFDLIRFTSHEQINDYLARLR